MGYLPEHVAGERARKLTTEFLASDKPPQTWNHWIDWAESEAHRARIFGVYLMNQRDLLAQACAVLKERLDAEQTLCSVGTQEVSWNHHHAQMSVAVKPATWRDRVRWRVLSVCWWVIEKLEGEAGGG